MAGPARVGVEPAVLISGAIRRYSGHDVARVRFIKRGQALGFRLDEIVDLLRLADGTQCDAARTIASDKLIGVREKLAQLRRIERELAALVKACAASGSEVAGPLIDTLLADAERSASSRQSPTGWALTKHPPSL